MAAEELQNHLKNQKDWKHNFGFDKKDKTLAIGKMFGVLVVENAQKELGYLSAFSGKLADKNHWPKFVPPVYDLLIKGDFFTESEIKINELNKKIEILEKGIEFNTLINQLKNTEKEYFNES